MVKAALTLWANSYCKQSMEDSESIVFVDVVVVIGVQATTTGHPVKMSERGQGSLLTVFCLYLAVIVVIVVVVDKELP